MSEYSVKITHDGVTYDYTKAICVMQNYPTKKQYISSIATLDFDLAGLDLFGLPTPGRGDYVVFSTRTFGEWFTGYIINNPSPYIMGQDQTATKRWLFSYQVNSDDYLLNLQSMPVNKVYINTTAGGIIKDLAASLLPGVFNLDNVQDGPLIGKYVLDPNKKFSDVVNDLAGNAYYRFYGQAKSLYFYPIDQAPQNVIIDGNNKYFTPDGLTQFEASTNPIVNDCTVLGDVEPQGKMADYFIGDGFTGEFQLTTGVYGLAEEVILDEQFANSTINSDIWTVYDTAEEFLQVSQGYLNCLGGVNDDSFNVFLQSNDPIPLEGTIRITHGQYDFVQQSDGIVGALYTDLVTAPVESVFTNCLYGLRVLPGLNGSTTLYPIVNGTVDTSQSLNINNYTMYNYRYTARTVITYELQNRASQEYAYFGSDGQVGAVGFDPPACNVTYQTFMAVIDPNTGAVVRTVNFTNSTTVSAATLYAFYTPFVSNNLNATVTGITVSRPLQATLALKSLQNPTYTLTAPGGDVTNSPDREHFLGQSVASGGDFTVNGSIASITSLNTGQQKAGFMVRSASDTDGTGQMVAVVMRADGVASMRYRATASTNVVEIGQVDQNNGVVDGLTLPQFFQLKKEGTTFSASYSSDGDAWTEIISTTLTFDGDMLVGPFVAGEDWATAEQVSAVFQQINLETSAVALAQDSPFASTHEADLGYQGLGWDAGFSTNTKDWTSELIGVNEIDTLDGLSPVAAIVQQTDSVAKNKNDRGSFQYNPGQCTLEYFSNSTTQTTEVPQQGDLVCCRYSRSGTSLARIVDNDAVEAESDSWGDSGHRAIVVSNLTPAPRTSDECAAAATATIKSSGWKHYNGVYTQVVTGSDGFGFSGEPIAGAVLPFVNMDDAAPGIANEIIQQVQSVLTAATPDEVYTHQLTFGPINTAQKFVNRLNQPQGITIPQDTAYIPNTVDIDAYNKSILSNIEIVEFTEADANGFHFQVDDQLNAGENLEVRSSDDSWGPDQGKNLIARVLNGAPQTFSTPRTPNGRIAFVRRYDTRNKLPYSEDLTKWDATSGITVTNSRQIDPDGNYAQVSTITVTEVGSVSINFPVTIAEGTSVSAMFNIKGPSGAPIVAEGDSVTVGYGLSPYGAFLYGDPFGYGTSPYGTSAYGDGPQWSMTVNGGISSNLYGGWDLIKLTGDSTVEMAAAAFSLNFTTPGTYYVTHAQFELNSVPTVYCRTNGAPYGALSRYSAGVRAQMPMIPPAPTGSVNITDPVNPVITLVLPAVLTDVWGFEIRDSDNKTVLTREHFGQTGFGQGFNMTYTVADNTDTLRSFYLYTFNLLNEYSNSFAVAFDVPYLVAPVSGLTIEDDDTTVSMSSNGTTTPCLFVKWNATTDANVVANGSYDIQYQLSTVTTAQNGGVAPSQPSNMLNPVQQSDGSWVSAWVDAGNVSSPSTSAFINGITQDQYATITVQVRAVRSDGVGSAWVQVGEHAIANTLSQQVTNLSASEAPYLTGAGIQSLVAVSFVPSVNDPYYDHAEVYFTGYNGNPDPQLMAQGSESPIQFLCDTTGEVVVVTVVAVNANGAKVPFASAPTAVVVLNGVQTAPPAPSIAAAQSALPSMAGWQFAFNVIGGLEAQAGLVSGYRVYHSESNVTPAPGNNYYSAYPQPSTNSGQIAVQEVTQDILYYWVSAYNSAGFESSLTPVPFFYIDPGDPAPTAPAPVQTTKVFSPSTLLNGWAANAHAGNYEGGGGLGSEVWGTNGATTLAYGSPSNAYDGNQSTAATSSQSHTHQYAGCIWSFANYPALASGVSLVSAQISIVSEIRPTSGPVAGHADIWYTLDGGSTWVKKYAAFGTRLKQTDTITLPTDQDITKVQVMAFLDSHDDIAHYVYEISLATVQSAPVGPEKVIGVTATLVDGNIQISWNSLAPLTRTDIVNYEVTRAVHGAGYSQSHIEDTVAWDGSASYSWTDLAGHDGSWDYWVIANNATGSSPASDTASLGGTNNLTDGTGSPLAGGTVAYAAMVASSPVEGDTLVFNGTEWMPAASGITQLTGDVLVGPGSGSQIATLETFGTSGTYTKVTTDTKGRVSSGTTLSASDIPNIAESQVVNLTSDLAGKATPGAVQQEAYTYAVDTGTDNAYAITLTPAPTLVAGSTVCFKAANTNSGASTLTVNGGSAMSLRKNGNSIALAAGDIVAGQIVDATYDGDVWQILVLGTGSLYFGLGTATAVGGETTITLGSTPLTNSVLIFIAGSILTPTSYTLSGMTITLATALTAGNVVVVNWATNNATPGTIVL